MTEKPKRQLKNLNVHRYPEHPSKFGRLHSLFEGELFRTAHPEQVSANGIVMSREELYVVDKVFNVEPFMRVCLLVDSDDARPRTLYPDAPILKPSAPLPTREEVERDLVDSPKTKTVVGYRVRYDGKVDLSQLLNRVEMKMFGQIYLTGRREFSKKDILAEVRKVDLGGRWNHSICFFKYAPHFIELGLLEPVVDDRGKVQRTLAEILGNCRSENKADRPAAV